MTSRRNRAGKRAADRYVPRPRTAPGPGPEASPTQGTPAPTTTDAERTREIVTALRAARLPRLSPADVALIKEHTQ